MHKKWFLVLMLLLFSAFPLMAQDTAESLMEVESADIEVMSGEQAYESFIAAPVEAGTYPGIVFIHSFNGMEQGYRDMVEEFAGHGFVVLAVGWQTFERQPADAVVQQLLEDSVAFLTARDDVDPERLGLTGFCAGGRYTMLFLPQIDAFNAGVAWYGFPYSGDPAPADLVDDLDAPMLIIHGTADEPSPIGDIYRYATQLTDLGQSFELKVYQGEPHGFMLEGGERRTDEVARNAFHEMVSYFQRKLFVG
jgi:carboxymethylenebutenolidase